MGDREGQETNDCADVGAIGTVSDLFAACVKAQQPDQKLL